MKVDLNVVADLLTTLSLVAPLTPAPQLAEVLAYGAQLVRLGEEANARREVLLAQVNTWVKEKRGPTQAELDLFKSDRDRLDLELATLESQLKGLQP